MERDAAAWLTTFARRSPPRLPDLGVIHARRWRPEKRAAARVVWARRVANESLSVDVARELCEVAPTDVPEGAAIAEALDRLRRDEEAHVELARALTLELDPAFAPLDAEAGPRTSPDEPPELRFMRLVVTGLAVCETVSAARLQGVLARTDLTPFKAVIALFLRDERAHSELGFVLAPVAVAALAARVGEDACAALVSAELRSAFAYLDVVIGGDRLRRGGVERPGPQPRRNPGVVAPIVDAFQFYDVTRRKIVPRLERLGIAASAAWDARHTSALG